MQSQTRISNSEKDTAATAQELAQKARAGDVFCLYGDLGAGKSVFARAFIRRLTHEEQDVPSPTFTLIQTYDSDKGPIAHFDMYRLEDPEEIFEIGWEDAQQESIVLVEWPQRLGPYLPPVRTDIHITTTAAESREITIDVHA